MLLFCALVCGFDGKVGVSEILLLAAGEVGVLYILDVLFWDLHAGQNHCSSLFPSLL